jgi:hypothetical protein
VLRVFLPGGTFIGRMYRSDGTIIAGETVYTYRASTGSDPLQHHAGEREVARGASMADAFQALLTATAEQHEPSVRPQSATVLAEGRSACPHRRGAIDLDSGAWHCYACGADVFEDDDQAEPYTIDGVPACGAPVDGGRCGRRPHHDGHLHIKEPGTEVRGGYYVMPHGFTAPASRPVARFPYAGLPGTSSIRR